MNNYKKVNKLLTIRTQFCIIENMKGMKGMKIKDIRKGNMTITSPGGNASKGHTLSSPSPPAFNLSQHQGVFK